jgi:hypothetical protein
VNVLSAAASDDRVVGICIVGEQVAAHYRIAALDRRHHRIDGDRDGEVVAREELPVLRDEVVASVP